MTEPSFESGVLRVACGPYAEGLAVTTDPSRPHDPQAKAPIFVDPARFATWKASKVLTLGNPPKVTVAAKEPDKKKEEPTHG